MSFLLTRFFSVLLFGCILSFFFVIVNHKNFVNSQSNEDEIIMPSMNEIRNNNNNNNNNNRQAGILASTSGIITSLSPAEFCSSSTFPCGLHGDCLFGACKCHASATLGYWDGARCDQCLTGFAGSDCAVACQGGAWNACGGHGICASGISGDGSCSCYEDSYFGFWTGPACSGCKAYFYPSTSCNNTCPGVGEGSAPCYGRGVCEAENPAVCSCDPGWNVGSGCKDCNASSYGAECAEHCVGFDYQTGLACSGHGNCNSGVRGDGTCTCSQFYGNRDCSKKCPNECSGHGVCDDGTSGSAECTCQGNFAPPDCAKCRTNVTGVNCTIACPKNGGVMCSGHGFCTEDTNQTGTGMCNCDLGYTGWSCQTACPGSPPCSGHGSCSVGSIPGSQPFCTCFTSDQDGYWTGDSCGQCRVEYNNSASCKAKCPIDPVSSAVCSDRGYCAEGKCYCDRTSTMDYCGKSCNISSVPTPQIPGQPCSLCGCELCVVPGTWGTTCGSFCPGNLRCDWNGLCDEGLAGTGVCQCFDGFTGAGCDLRCPTSGSPPKSCGGVARGQCVTVATTKLLEGTTYSAACVCNDGFAGVACENSCPFFNGAVCSNHGKCNATTSKCSCDPGWTGKACNIICGCNSEFGSCDSDYCDVNVGNSASTCFECICQGNFSGLCFNCKNGTQGEKCDSECANGTTTGRSCVCNTYFSSPSCNIQCPIDMSTNSICSGHGICDWGAEKSGTCACQADWYGSFCNISCSDAICKSRGKQNPQCNKTTGECECLNDGLAIFVGTSCQVCADNYWGPLCSEPCACSGHGSCADDTGECRCFASDIEGFYAGTGCTVCASGYIGNNCEKRNIAFTPLTRSISVTTQRNLSARIPFLWANPKSGDILVGSGGVVAISSTPGGNAQEYGSVTNATDLASLGCEMKSVATSWVDNGFMYAFLQPCKGSIRLYQMPVTALGTAGAAWTPHGDWKLDLLNSSVVISHAITKVVGSGTSAGYVALLIVSQPNDAATAAAAAVAVAAAEAAAEAINTDATSGSSTSGGSSSSTIAGNYAGPKFIYYPGPSAYRIQIDTILTNAAISAHIIRNLDAGFYPADVDLLYSEDLFEEVIAIGGKTAGLGWDLLLLKKQINQLQPYLPTGIDTTSVRSKMKCFPKITVAADYCPDCTEIVKVRMTSKFGVVAAMQHISKEPFIIWFQSDVTLVNNQLVWASRNARPCELAEYDSGLQQLRSLSSGLNFLPPDFVIEMVRTLVTNSRVTAMTVDEPGDVIYVALHSLDVTQETPGVLTKFALFHGNLSILGTFGLGYAVSEGRAVAEAAEFLVVNPVQRILYALIADVPFIRVLSYLAYEVHSFEPDLADVRGGTNVTVRGLGFFSQSGFQPMCDFGVQAVPATIADSRTVFCVAPQLQNNSAVGSCSGQPVEASLFGPVWMTANSFTIQRVNPARIEGSTVPDRGSLLGQANISIAGTGFQPSNYATCKFYSNNSDAIEVLYSPLRYISPTSASCDQPAAKYASFDTSYIDVSLDGQLYSDGVPAQYQIVGAPTNVSSPATFSTVAVGVPDPVGNFTSIRTFQIAATIVDEQNHRLESLDTQTRTVCFATIGSSVCIPSDFSWRSPGDPYPVDSCRNNTFDIKSSATAISATPDCIIMTQGRAIFTVKVADARSGTFDLQFYTFVGSAKWFSTTSLAIAEGAAYALAILNKKAIEARPVISEGTALSPAPEIAVVDRLGNILPKLVGLDQNFIVTAQAYYVLDDDPGIKINTNKYVLPRQDAGKIRFSQIFITRYIHGANHYINFTSANPELRSALSPPLRTEPCKAGNSSFKLPNSSSCLPCPTEGAVCDGSELIIVLPGYWNGTTIGNIFKCPGGPTVCLGSTYGASPCAEGYEGPLCALCVRKDKNGNMWGKSGSHSCSECPEPAVAAVFLSLGSIGLVIALFVWSFVILRQPEVTDLSVIFRTVVNHLQAAGNLGDFSSEMSPLVRGVLQTQDAASSPSFSGLSSLDCVIRRSNQDYEALFYAYMALPLISFFMAVLMYIFVRLTKKVPVITEKLREDIEEDMKNMPSAPSAIFLQEYPFYVVAITTLSVNMFTMYQTLIAQSTAVLRCTELVIVPPNSTTPTRVAYLDVDMTIQCDLNGNHKLRTAAYIFYIVYGFGIPGIFYIAYKFFYRRVGNIEIMKLMFMFLTGGYKDHMWFWQALIMVRKLFLVVVVVFMADTGDLQAYAGMWVMSAALLLQLYFSPNEKHEHNQVEAISLAVIVTTLNLGFLYNALNDIGRIFLTICLIGITFGMLIVFAYFMFEPLRLQILEVRDVALQALSDLTDNLSGKKKNEVKKIAFDDDDIEYELEEVLPQMKRLKSEHAATSVLDHTDNHEELSPEFRDIEEIDTMNDDDVQEYVRKKREERLSKFDDML